MTKLPKKFAEARSVRRIFYALTAVGVIIGWQLKGKAVTLFDPKGYMATEEHRLTLLITAILLLIAIPTLSLFYFYAWKYRETNETVMYDPRAQNGKRFLVMTWTIPCVFMIVLSVIMWTATHRLEPQKAIAANAKPLTIQVVALRWKWLFIYPEQKIASVNFVQIPTNTPVRFELTADDTPMSSFWIPHLGGMLYAMTGHVNTLNLMADQPGDYPGSTAEINGPGFASMKFIARASSTEAYESWVQAVRQNSGQLDSAEYAKMLAPSENNNVVSYNLAEQNLYDTVVTKYVGSHNHQIDEGSIN